MYVRKRGNYSVSSFCLQGTRLRVQPREIAAYDQDLGINAAIVYSFNSGEYDTSVDFN